MTDPPRLCDDGDPFERALLGSARRDHGSMAAQMRCIVAASTATAIVAHAGSAAASTTAASTTATYAVANSGVAASTGTATATLPTAAVSSASVGTTSVGLAMAAKAVVIGFALGISAQGAVVVKRHFSADGGARAATSGVYSQNAQTATRGNAIARPPAVLPAAPATAIEQPPPQAPATRLAKASHLALGTAVVDNDVTRADAPGIVTGRVLQSDGLEREVALIDGARQFCLAGNYARALSLLDRHQQEFPTPSLEPESLVIRVQALFGLGRRAEAERLALPFIAGNPASPVTKRLNALLGRTEPSPETAR